jgi:hypothetical protein
MGVASPRFGMVGMDPYQYPSVIAAGYEAGSRSADARLQDATARLGLTQQGQLAREKAAADQARFNQVFGLLSGQLGTAGGFGRVGPAQFAGQPRISAAPIYSGQRIQENVNLQRAQGDAATAGRIREMQQSLAGQGGTAQSPLARQLAAIYQGQNLQTGTAAETAFRTKAAEANAAHVLAAQRAQEAQFGARQDERIRRAQVGTQAYSALLSALGNLV